MSIFYRRHGAAEWTRDREIYGTRQDDRRVAKLRSQGYEVVIR